MNEPTPNHDSDSRRLTDEERQIEQALDRGDQVGDVAALQDRIDASLRRSFAPKQAPQDLIARLREAERVSLPPAPTAAAKKQRIPSWAVAALLMIAIGSWLFSAREMLNLMKGPEGYAQLAATEVYHDAVEAGFKPDWFCEDEKRFADTFAERQGEGVWLRPLPEGTRMAGLAYLQGFAPQATCLLAWSNDQPVLVLVAKASKVDRSQLEAASGVQVFTQELGDLLVVEVSPLDTPLVTPALYLREPPAEPTGRVPGASS